MGCGQIAGLPWVNSRAELCATISQLAMSVFFYADTGDIQDAIIIINWRENK